MRWSIVVLIVLGVLAAACAAMLMGTFRASMRSTKEPTTKEAGTVEIAVAAKELLPMTVLDANSVETKTIARSEMPEGCIEGDIGVVGKVLTISMVKGQPFLAKSFATDGTRQTFAKVLPKGMRAVSIPLPRHSGLEGLLYPGCRVDVLASFRVTAQDNGPKEAISRVLIEGIVVLAIGNHTIVSPEPEETEDGSARSRRNTDVTLLVNPQQAEALQLAMEHGSLSLAMRGPADDVPGHGKGTSLSELSEDLARMMRRSKVTPTGRPIGETPAAPDTRPIGPVVEVPGTADPLPPDARTWTTIVIRGGKVHSETFDIDEKPDGTSEPN